MTKTGIAAKKAFLRTSMAYARNSTPSPSSPHRRAGRRRSLSRSRSPVNATAHAASSANAVWTSFHTTPTNVSTKGVSPRPSTANEPARLPVSAPTHRASTQSAPQKRTDWSTSMEAIEPVTAISARHTRLSTGGCQSVRGSFPSAWRSWSRLSGLRYPGAKTRIVARQQTAATAPCAQSDSCRGRHTHPFCPI